MAMVASGEPECVVAGPRAALLGLPLRLALGGLMAFSGWMKLGIRALDGVLPAPVRDQLDFYFSIKAFKLGLSEDLMRAMAGALPWAELICGVLLVLGLWARSAAAVIGLMMVGFMGGIVSLMARGIKADCPCFGAIKLLCSGDLGACHLVRNTAFLLVAGAIVYLGAGPLSIDRLLGRPR